MNVNKRRLHHTWRKIKAMDSWILVVLIVGFSALSIYGLRQNNLKMIELRDNLIAVDEADGDIDAALRELGDHITNHMNTRLNRPVELIHSYNRAVEAARADAEASTDSSIYRKAQQVCEDPSIPLTARAQCIQDYIDDNARPGENPQPLELPSKDFFTYDFAAPVWSFDLAGLGILFAAFFSIALLARIFAGIIIKRILKDHQ
ncbi:MAG: hypothetical protein R3313_02810 [Candidatus Saccharimonadales bacterium]|nr:hypothetical protein [Candidatus Saccharimonadales bacterium]